MNVKRSKLMQIAVVAVVMIGLLIAAWPGVAQNEETTLDAKRISDIKARSLPEICSNDKWWRYHLQHLAVQTRLHSTWRNGLDNGSLSNLL